MKTWIVLTILITVIILIAGIYTMTIAKTETQKYEVLYSKNNFEIRIYPEAILASVQMKGSFDDTRNSGFGVLAGYIFGGNTESTKIAMTSPVRMSTESNLNTMSFVMPSEMEFEKLPHPNDTNIVLHQSKTMYTASLRFGGYASDAEILKYKKQLNEKLDQMKIKHTGNFEFLGYNPPFQPVNRRNEVQVELTRFNSDMLPE